MAKRILVAGSSNIDFRLTTPYIPAPGETLDSKGRYTFTAGGKGANAAVAAASLGADVVFCSRVGDDAYGDRLVALFGEKGIDTRFVKVDKTDGDIGTAKVNTNIIHRKISFVTVFTMYYTI